VTWVTNRLIRPPRRGSIATAVIIGVVTLLSAGAAPSGHAAPRAKAALEEIYILRSIREQREATADWCSSAKTGFEPFAKDADRFFSFWSLRLRADGRVIEAKDKRAAELRACFGATSEPARQNFYAPGSRPVPGTVSARPDRTARPVCRRAFDDQYDHQQGGLWRRHGSSRIHPSLDCHDPSLEIQVRRCAIPGVP
jgi:hypothetical protein